MKKKSTDYKPIPHLKSVIEGHVLIHEADPLGIVWHGNYLKYFEAGREDFGRKFDLNYLDIKKHLFTTPIVEIHCDYKIPLKYGEKYSVLTQMLACSGPKIMLQYQVLNQEGNCCCSGISTQVFVSLDGELALYEPEFYEKWKQAVAFDSH